MVGKRDSSRTGAASIASDDADATPEQLRRQLAKEHARYNELARAYKLTVANLVEATRAYALLERECNQLKAQASAAPDTCGPSALPRLTPAEIGAIRKLMARLHHPDAGGDAERMKAWNAALDQLER